MSLSASISILHVCNACIGQKERWIPWNRTGITNGCLLSWGCWEPNLSPLEKHPVLLNIDLIPKTPYKNLITHSSVHIWSHWTHSPLFHLSFSPLHLSFYRLSPDLSREEVVLTHPLKGSCSIALFPSWRKLVLIKQGQWCKGPRRGLSD